MSASLTDRYVWAVLRAVPGAQRADLEPEIRALVADTIDAKAGAGSLNEAEAERAALVELGNPNQLAMRYVDGPRHLIGPAVYPEWKRLTTTLVAVLVPIIGIVTFAASMVGSGTIGQSIVHSLGSAFSVAVQTVFWITLVFAVIERTVNVGELDGKPWTPDALPDLPDDGRMSLLEVAGTVVVNILVIGGLLWVQLQPPIQIEGSAYPLFDPALWSFWLPWFIVVTVLEIVFTVVLYLRGRWTYVFAVVNAVLGAAFAVPALYLWQNDLLLNPDLVAAISASTGSRWIEISGTITAIAIVAVVAWDAIDGFRKAYQASRPALRG